MLAALAAAMLVPDGPPGAGIVIVAALVAAAGFSRATRTRDLAIFGSAALALASMSAVLDARWVVVLDLCAAWVFLALAVDAPRIVALAAPIVSLRWIRDLAPPPTSLTAPATRGVGIAVLLLVPFFALFWTADAAFAEVVSAPVPDGESIPVRIAAFVAVLALAVGLVMAARRKLEAPNVALPREPRVLEWALPLALLDVLFLGFVAVQITVLFAGHDYVRETTGLTYSEYARQGFWQLLGAAVLTVAVISAAKWAIRPAQRSHDILLRVLLGVLSLLTVVVLVSALHRLHLYEDAFGLTRLRLFAYVVDFWLAGLFALLLLTTSFGSLRRWLPRAIAAGSAALLLAFSLASPDRLIASRNIDRWRSTGEVDVGYLQGLSADAASTLVTLPEPLRSTVLRPLRTRLAKDEPWSSANLSRADARNLLAR